MNLEELVRNYELARANAASTRSPQDHETYFDLVAYYAKRIREAKGDADQRRSVLRLEPKGHPGSGPAND